ncbi:MAG TPA: isoprenyl transferase [Aggregatilineales bacterium]|jgi:undecaprenyl diphosphate synthase|nr:isoprenyl transferase [Aggregatilineales bacterium]
MIAAPVQQADPATQPAVSGKPDSVPRHIAIIMDGNGRWAKARGLPRTEGHRHGTENLRQIIKACVEFGVEILTIYAFSTENWRRPPLEVRMLMTILERVIDNELEELRGNGVQIRHIGKPDQIAPVLLKKIKYACELTKNNRRLILNVAFNYGGRDEIVQAVQRIIEDKVPANAVTEQLLASYMYTGDLPDPDLIVRTSGELRVSNFLIWQGAYSELYVTPVYWPDFDKNELRKAIEEYNLRTRRFGKTDEQLDGES